MSWYSSYYEKVTKYFSKHVIYNSTIHGLGGVAVGVLIARPLDGGHPLKLALILGGIAILGHLYPLTMKRVK